MFYWKLKISVNMEIISMLKYQYFKIDRVIYMNFELILIFNSGSNKVT